jgi:hypothetical protein
MMPSTMKKEELILAKKEEIANYERILNDYHNRGRGRWYDYGKRSLERLKDELKVLEEPE